MTAEQSVAMSRTYVSGPFATVVGAGSTDLLMNLGWTPHPDHPSTVAQRQLWLADRLISRLQAQSGHVIADIGCGKGGLARLITTHRPGVRVLGVNVDHAQLLLARPTDAAPAYLVGSAERLPLQTGSVDAAVVVELLGHLGDKPAFWREVSRVVRPGGRLVIAAITIRRPLAAFDPAARSHLARLAAYFAERAEDLPVATDIRTELERRAWTVRDEDLSAGVYEPRHADMRAVLDGLTAPDRQARAAARAAVRTEWGADPDVLADYLEACTSSPASNYYEYHLITAVAP
jgi:ubiquinone/menaquinone biosynthesis C-methylase UbiE